MDAFPSNTTATNSPDEYEDASSSGSATTMTKLLAGAATAASVLSGPGTPAFALVSVFAFGTVGGLLTDAHPRLRLPSLVGQLLAGMAVRASGLADGLPPDLSSNLRALALAMIMVRAGLGLCPVHLRQGRIAALTLLLAAVPCLAEAGGVAFAANRLLDLPWGWGWMLGFVLSDVSPAVTVPLLLDLQEGGYGRRGGLCTVLLAAASLNGVFAIVGFGVCFTIVLGGAATATTVDLLARGAAEIAGGCLAGSALGLVVASKSCWDDVAATATVRAALVLVAAAAAIFGGRALSMSGGGALGALCVGAAVAAARRPRPSQDGNTATATTIKERRAFDGVTRVLGRAWGQGAQVLLFALLGAAIPNLRSVTGTDVRLGAAVVVAGLAVRFGATLASVRGSGWTRKERLFAALAWCPKATVQAALSTVALDFVESDIFAENDGGEYGIQRRRAILLLNVAVLSILLTAPVFAAAIKLVGPHWLECDDDDAEEEDSSGCEGGELVPLQLREEEEEENLAI